ncbi:hypothetical protein Tcan_17569 [Toxocara canis]|uniref:Uncharacterized protein n=1 Tax=Toxocara canis TaxID=6265 RepID=A0A0B2UUS5_TOXCA|nr:hypothetical protein Tcan_17569 [Toxocara canis]
MESKVGKNRCDVYMALLGCGKLRIAIGGKIASCIDGENDKIDEITAVQGIQGKVNTFLHGEQAGWRCTTDHSNMESKVGKNRCDVYTALLGCGKWPAASMERTKNSMKSQLFKVFKVR